MNYSDCVIYKITCKNPDIKSIYAGHTFNLYKRSLLHKINCNNSNTKQYNSKLYTTIRDNGGFNNWTIEVVENYIDCSSLDDARARERYWCDELHADLNTYRPIISDDELKVIKKNVLKKQLVRKDLADSLMKLHYFLSNVSSDVENYLGKL